MWPLKRRGTERQEAPMQIQQIELMTDEELDRIKKHISEEEAAKVIQQLKDEGCWDDEAAIKRAGKA